ncbi:MAG: universal stress protein [bacterium]
MGYKKIVCAVTGSEASERAALEAAFLARESQAPLVFLYAVDASFVHGMTVEVRPEFAEKSLEHMGRQILERMEEIARKEGVQAKGLLKRGRLMDVIKKVVLEEGADLLVLGKEKPSFFEKVLFKQEEVEDHVDELRKRTSVEVMLVK